MRSIVFGIAAVLAATVGAHAQNADVVAGSSSNNDVRVNVQSNGSEIPRRTRVTTTGAAIAPGLAAGAIVCAQSTSVAGGFMGGAFSFGSTRKDDDCNGRAWIATMGAMAGATRDGRYIQAAQYIACDLPMPGKALRQAGFVCPGDQPRQVAQRQMVVQKTGRQARTGTYGAQVVAVKSGDKVAARTQGEVRQKVFNHIDQKWMYRDAKGRWSTN